MRVSLLSWARRIEAGRLLSGDAVEEAHLSSAASLASHAASLPDVRTEKVQSVQAAIASGGYNISASDVANSLMGHMLSNKE